MVRVLLVHNYYQLRGGEDRVVANEQALLKQFGHTVELHAVHNSAISGVAAKWAAFRSVAYNIKARDELAERLRAGRPDVVHVHNTFPLLSPSVYDACADADVPVVQTLHNFRLFCAGAVLLRNGAVCELCKDGRPYRAVMYRCYRNSVVGSLAVANLISYHNRRQTWSNKVARFIALSKFARSKFIEAGFPADRMAVKPNFVMDPGVPESAPREGVLLVGRLSPEKGVVNLVRALSGTGVQLRVLGDGPELPALRAEATANISFEGGVSPERVREAMRRANILVVPSIWHEPFGLVVVEAFANGLPVVASRSGSLAEIIEDDVTGRLVPPADPPALLAAVTELLADPARLRAMGMAARERYERRYSGRHNIKRLLEIYHEALGWVRPA